MTFPDDQSAVHMRTLLAFVLPAVGNVGRERAEMAENQLSALGEDGVPKLASSRPLAL